MSVSFFSCLSETIGVLTIIPVFLIISGEKPDSGFVSTVYQFFSDLGLTDNLITILIFFIFAISLKSLLRIVELGRWTDCSETLIAFGKSESL